MVTMRECDACGKAYVAQRVTSKFCSPKCRIDNHKKRPPTVTPPRPSAVIPPPVDEGSVCARSRAKLEAAERLDTWEAAVALQLAARLDAQVREGGMGLAAIVREHRAAMTEALKGAAVAADGVDELRERRDRRRAG